MARSPRPSQANRQRENPEAETGGTEDEFSSSDEGLVLELPPAVEQDEEFVDNERLSSVASRESSAEIRGRVTPEARSTLFTMSSTGRPAKFAVHRQATHEQRAMTIARIRAHGGRPIDSEYKCDVYLVPQHLVHESETRFQDSREVYVQSLGWVMSCIKSKTFLLAAPSPKRMPGRPPGHKRLRVDFTAADDENLCQYLARKCPFEDQGGRKGNRVYQELMKQADVEPTKAWAKRHTWHSWRQRYKTKEARMNDRISEIVAHLPPVHDPRKGQLEYIRDEAVVRYRRPRRELADYQNRDADEEDVVFNDNQREEDVTLNGNQRDEDEGEEAAVRGDMSPITMAGLRNQRTHWRKAGVVPIRRMDPKDQRAASRARGTDEQEEEEDVPRSSPQRRVSPVPRNMPPPDTMSTASSSKKSTVRPRPVTQRRSEQVASDGNLSLEVPEEGMDFMANMPEPDNPVVTRPAAHRGLKPGVARTYSRISSPDRPNQTSFSSQPTLVDLSQRAGPSQSRGSDDERPHPSGLVPQRSRRPITDNSVRSEQDDVDALSSPEGSPWPTVHDIDKVLGSDEEPHVVSATPAESDGERGPRDRTNEADNESDEQMDDFSREDANWDVGIGDTEENEVDAALLGGRASHRAAKDDAEPNMFDGESFDSHEIERSSPPRRHVEPSPRRSPSSSAASAIYSRLQTAANAGFSPASLEPQLSSKTTSLSTPNQSVPRAGLTTIASVSRRRPRSTSPASQQEVQVIGSRARAEVERQRQQSTFTPGFRAERQIKLGTAHLRRSKRQKP